MRRRPSLPSLDVGTWDRIPITSPVPTLIDLATELPTKYLARAVNEADKLEVILADDPRRELDAYVGVPGAKRLCALLDKDTFVLTEEELERLFLPLVREVGLPLLRTKEIVNGHEVDFFWPDLSFVVETDGLRFSHHQVKYERAHVKRILGETATRLTPCG